MTIQDEIKRIEKLAKAIKPPPGLPAVRAEAPLAVGQVWRTRWDQVVDERDISTKRAAEPFLVVVTKLPEVGMAEQVVCEVLPLHRDIPMTGPDDVILPANLFGHRVVACAGATVPALVSSLSYRIGMLPDDWVRHLLNFRNWLDGIHEHKPDILTGLRYLDQNDIRWKYKEDLGADLDYLQAPALEQIFPDEYQELGTLVLFPLAHPMMDDELALAADASFTRDRPLKSIDYQVFGLDAVVRICEAEASGWVTLEVRKDSNGALPGACVVNNQGDEIARIVNDQAYFELPANRILGIRLVDGRRPELKAFDHGDPSDGATGDAMD